MKALDLFCGAGGVSVGLQRAGFEVTGVDIRPQPRYRGGTFVQADALTFPLDGYDLIWASPPCQAFTVYGNNRGHVRADHPNLIATMRERLAAVGAPHVIENVPGAPLRGAVQLCGTSFPPLEVRRHRLFEASFPLLAPPCDHGRLRARKYPGSSNRPNGRTVCNVGEWRVPFRAQCAAMGIDWMTLEELSQAIPPAYATWIGEQAMRFLRESAA